MSPLILLEMLSNILKRPQFYYGKHKIWCILRPPPILCWLLPEHLRTLFENILDFFLNWNLIMIFPTNLWICFRFFLGNFKNTQFFSISEYFLNNNFKSIEDINANACPLTPQFWVRPCAQRQCSVVVTVPSSKMKKKNEDWHICKQINTYFDAQAHTHTATMCTNLFFITSSKSKQRYVQLTFISARWN